MYRWEACSIQNQKLDYVHLDASRKKYELFGLSTYVRKTAKWSAKNRSTNEFEAAI